MIKNAKGGGNTQSGLKFEERVDLITLLKEIDRYTIKNTTNNSGVYILQQ